MKPKLDKGAVMTLASQIQEKILVDVTGRSGWDGAYDGFDRETQDEIRKTQTKLIAEEIEKFFA
jgi:hypothetical protein